MSIWVWVLFASLAVVIAASYAAGRVAGLGRAEQELGDMADELAAALIRGRALEQRCADQSARIRALTEWELIGRDTNSVPGLLRAVPVPRTAPAENMGREHRRVPDRRGRAARAAAFLSPPVPALTPVGEPLQAGPGDPAPAGRVHPSPGTAGESSWDEWPVIEAQIRDAKTWLAAFPLRATL